MSEETKSLLVLNWLDGSYIDLYRFFTNTEIEIIKHHLDDKLNFRTVQHISSREQRANWAYRIAFGKKYHASPLGVMVRQQITKKIRRICGLDKTFPLINGVSVSYRQLELQRILGAGEINKDVNGRFIDIAYDNVAIEYDHVYWHNELDEKRDIHLLEQGYIPLHIVADDFLPTKKTLLSLINHARSFGDAAVYIRYLRGDDSSKMAVINYKNGAFEKARVVSVASDEWVEFEQFHV